MRQARIILRSIAVVAGVVMPLLSSRAGAATIAYNRDQTPTETEESTTYVFTNTGTPAGINATVPSNSSTDLANGITPVLLVGTPHSVSGPITKLTDGPGATNSNDTANNFFFDDATTAGRIRISLLAPANISQINSYSWHSSIRAPQKYDVYAAGALTSGQLADDATDITDYTLIASVDESQGSAADDAGQWGVSISPSSGPSLGLFQNFVFVIADADRTLGAANEFYSEIDIVGSYAPEPSSAVFLAGLAAFIGRRRPSVRR